MNIQVYTSGKELQNNLLKLAKFYASQLNLKKSKYEIIICTDPSLKKEGTRGLCAKTGHRQITILLYSRLNPVMFIYTLAHEMVHAKQICRGQYSLRLNKSKTKYQSIWLGKVIKAKYENRPWEKEAFIKEDILVDKLLGHISKKKKVDNKYQY